MLDDDELPYDALLFAGTHNSAINLGERTVLRPHNAEGGAYPSEAHLAYEYLVMNQRLSVLDQLEQGVRVLDFEVASLDSTKWACNSSAVSMGTRCIEETHITTGRCFRDCPFIVSHGSLDESIGDFLGYTYPESVFSAVAEFVEKNPLEIVTVMLLASHGNRFPSGDAVVARMNVSGLLQYVWNLDPSAEFTSFPTLGEMRRERRTVLLLNGYGSWGPRFHGSHCNSTDILGADGTCTRGTPCMEGWDAVSFFQLDPRRAVLSKNSPRANTTTLFAIENLSSRRGRDDHSAKYWPLPNELHDAPFQAGGNPAQAAAAANYTHIRSLELAWTKLLAPYGSHPNWILVDFFNTTTPKPGVPSRALRPNPSEGLIRAVRDINNERIAAWRQESEVYVALKTVS
ncbi:hypothetical protein CYMTET_24346 [Cymbomonas tetramitiformis]|uniref:Uncharacterized protein n=1 Tax=Cymbomonas tetramitiformis TaxID=36881 RepID=A0AAE0FW30_9CHLO|nr:hypothetical protein CYMTET_24346 [Cymbomonas tetramitiformis]